MTERQITLRLAGEADRAELLALLLEAYEQYRELLGAERWSVYRASIAASAEEDRADARIVAEWNGRLVGSVFLFKTAEAAYGHDEPRIATPVLRLLAVSPLARGRGIATRLIRESVKIAGGWGADAIHLHTSDMMASAVQLYERLGLERAPDKEYEVEGIWVKCYRIALADFAAPEANRLA